MAIFLSDDAHVSEWLDQETGWALARGLLIIPVNIGLNPYGFAARYQSIRGAELAPGQLADLILDLEDEDEEG